ncbi:hypothetical protein [Bosea sp. LjRoot237]|uniref:hypothetical protein n=1 Tax=Bosea sp. LjRoot237 TaxID=3342292 RepID=UPI003F4FE750
MIGKLYENTSIITAANAAFADWPQLFAEMATGMLDRFADRRRFASSSLCQKPRRLPPRGFEGERNPKGCAGSGCGSFRRCVECRCRNVEAAWSCRSRTPRAVLFRCLAVPSGRADPASPGRGPPPSSTRNGRSGRTPLSRPAARCLATAPLVGWDGMRIRQVSRAGIDWRVIPAGSIPQACIAASARSRAPRSPRQVRALCGLCPACHMLES